MLALIEWLDTGPFNLALTASPLVWRQIKTMVSSVRKGAYAVGFRASLFIVMASFSAKKKIAVERRGRARLGLCARFAGPASGEYVDKPEAEHEPQAFWGNGLSV